VSESPAPFAIAIALIIVTLQLFSCSSAPTLPPEVQAAEVCIRGARVFDGERDLGVRDVAVRAGRIAAVAPDACAGVEDAVDGRDQTLLPGLFDAHSHNGGASLQIQAQFGVTSTLDMAARAPWAAERRAEQRSAAAGSDALQRADLFSPGPPATVPGGHGTEYGLTVPTISDPEQVPEWMQARRDEGADYVKVIYEHGTVIAHPVPTFELPTLQAVVAGARKAGLRTVAHVSTVQEALEFVAAGGNGLAHVPHDRVPTAEELETFRRAGTFVVPTLVVYAPDYGLRAGAELLDEPDFLGPLAPAWRQNLARTRRQPPRHADFAERPIAAVRALHAAGVPILAGSDAPNLGTAYGASLHHELEFLVRAGLSPAEALRAATAAPARAFGLNDRGRIAVGLRADLLLVRGNPMQDVRATRRIVAVWKRGVRIERRAASADDGSMNAATVLGSAQGAGAGNVEPRDLLPLAVESTDAVRGGTSTVTLTRGEAEGAPLLTVAADTHARASGQSWAGVVWWPTGKPFEPADARGLEMTLRLRGDGRPVRVVVFLAGGGKRKQEILWLPTSERFEDHRLHMEELGTDGRGLAGVLLVGDAKGGPQRFELGGWRLVAPPRPR
jgi:imidazolonepropionase-like amidohydrolase